MADNIITKASTGKPNVGGAVHMGATTATLPTSATATLTGFTCLGGVSEDGLKNAPARKVDSIKDWNGAEVLAPQTEFTDTFSFSLLDCKDINVLKAVFGDDNVSGTYSTGIHVKVNPSELEYHAWVFDMILSDGDLKRIVVPKAKITEVAEITYKSNEAIDYGITLSAAADSNGDYHHEYIVKKPTT